MRSSSPFNVLENERALSVLRRLHKAADRQLFSLLSHYLPKVPRLLLGRPMAFSDDDIKGYYADKFIALDPQQAAFCYLTARGMGARCVVEFGTSLGVSTIWLAAAVRANGGGRVITAELVPEKAKRARAHLEEAGLADLVDIRIGDARETLADLPGTVDLFLNDGFPMLALDVLRLVAPHMRAGAITLTDNVGTFKGNYKKYLKYVRDQKNGFVSTILPYKSGTAYSLKTG
ncbi:MAG: class I SAM-dependent methyltransferase [Pseudomonadota bacterium]